MELRSFFYPLRRFWWLIAGAMLLAGMASFIATRELPPIYIARTTLIVGRSFADPNPSSNEFTLGRQLAGIYADVARREPVRRATEDALGLSALPDYDVRILPNSQLIEITVTDSIPERAQAVADELARQLIRRSPGEAESDASGRGAFVTQQLDYLQEKILETQTALEQEQVRLGGLTSAVEINAASDQIDALQTKLNALQNNYASLLSSTGQAASNTLSVIEPAELPTEPVGASRALLVGIATVLGLLLAAGAAHLLDYLDDSVHRPQDAEAATGVPVVGSVGKIRGDSGRGKLVTVLDPFSAASESFRLMRAAIRYAASERPIKSLLITSANSAEGKSLLAANLAIVMAQAGERVLLVDADVSRPAQHDLFALPNGQGLATFFDMERKNDSVDFEELIQGSGVEGLDVLTSGPRPEMPIGLLERGTLTTLLESVEDEYDFVLVDSPAALAVADALYLAKSLDGVLLAVDAGCTSRADLTELRERLDRVQAQVVGVVLNRYSQSTRAYNGYFVPQTTEEIEEPQPE